MGGGDIKKLKVIEGIKIVETLCRGVLTEGYFPETIEELLLLNAEGISASDIIISLILTTDICNRIKMLEAK